MPTIIFDTSGLNELARDPESGVLLAGIRSGFRVRLTETNVNEISATRNAERRELLLRLCQRLVNAGDCIRSSQWILNAMSSRHSADPEGFDWRQVGVGFQALEEEISRRRFLGNDGVADELRTDNKTTHKEFKALLKAARAEVAPLTWDGASTATEVLDLLTVDNSPLWRLAEDIYRYGAGNVAADIRGFVGCCPPVEATLFAVCVGLYQWGARRKKQQSVYGAGALDLLMAAYLPYCDWFITADSGQYAALHLLRERAGLRTEITKYSAWKESILVA